MKIINFGSLNIDKVCSVEEFVQPGETIMATGYSVNAGGKGLNQPFISCSFRASMEEKRFSGYSLHILNLGVERIQEAARIPGGSISIGYIHTQGRRFIPELVRGFLDEQEGKKIDFHFQNAATGNFCHWIKITN